MINTKIPIYLASKSPRRRKLLKQLGINFKVFSVNTPEDFLDGEHPVECVKRIALEKMELAKLKVKGSIIITADTIVVLHHKVIGKPVSKSDAIKILSVLSGKVHTVYTGFCVLNQKNDTMILDYEKTDVEFRKLLKDEITDYVDGGSPMDKAGAYGIQDDFGAVFVKRINGCYYNVVGLPLTKLYKAIREVV
ncbi:MAG: septum formation protein Maf [Ignavibacteriota bacterium]|jgi:septum formation protein|nr:septum formation protein Maf [Ignavibacteriales bacterium]MBL1123872.1 septum formation protein Maf [Ignavibacteriota bacterium]MCC7095104.1 septum formation protein Maf [Ignavibacteriaceae bacterium]MCE7855078.1 septum formation protein Maf [Ignavibacteria bacterium CHB3]MEB2295763.1 Maf family protein [Ignavibacteria bacterium]